MIFECIILEQGYVAVQAIEAAAIESHVIPQVITSDLDVTLYVYVPHLNSNGSSLLRSCAEIKLIVLWS